MRFSIGDIVDFRWPADGRKFYRGRITKRAASNSLYYALEVLSAYAGTRVGATEYSAEVNLRYVPALVALAEAAE